MKKTAVVTGASSGIGHAIAGMLCEEGFEVYGFGRNFERDESESCSPCFYPVICDLSDTDLLLKKLDEIKKSHRISILVNAAGIGYYGPHEEINIKKIQEMVRINLEVPMILTQYFLRDLKKEKGYVINISSVTAQKTNTHGCAYGATKAGLTSFSGSLFEEIRKYGVKVVAVHPDMTKTNLYRHADFCEGEEEESYLFAEEIAEVVREILNQRDGVVVTSVTVRPQIHRIRKK